ncbi:39S ribosomal protein L39, mitochondrial [Tetranychus urticae]|uniref:TGS domain-containing protein n=1 Tax=Tetranychus urticae TaxID=32264 RepID=T1KI75_TETUR|nr:39S ribosomal protein L39, mitochondrial [Tetranychus urticae]
MYAYTLRLRFILSKTVESVFTKRYQSSLPASKYDYILDRSESNRLRNEIFDEEKKRQSKLIPRIEKIEVQVKNVKPFGDATLIMNKHASTPYHCAQHFSQLISDRSIIAVVDGKNLWDMHRPLNDSCILEFKHFKDEDPTEVNRAFWRSCSFLLGMVVQRAFKSEIPVYLHSWPKPSIRSGCFIYDVQLPSLPDWKPDKEEIRSLTAMFWKLNASTKSPFERLDVKPSIAKDIFKDNKFKSQQVDKIEKEIGENGQIALYRLSDHIDFSVGPMIPDTSHIGRVSVACVHKLDSDIENLYRFQGVAIPSKLPIHFFPYRILLDRASKPKTNLIPQSQT